jgi:hypothetical protein
MSDKTPEQEFAAALAAFQSDVPAIRKENTATVRSDKGNYSYSYADLTDISEAALPLLAKQGLSFTAMPTITEHGFVLRYSLLHEAGHREGGDFPLPDASKFGAQQIGSWLTYARRYALCAITGIAPGGDDDDGEKAKDARAQEPLPRAPLTRGATERKTAEQVAGEPDPWATATPATEPERVTDAAWIEDFRRRVDAAGSASELRGLQGEANGQWSKHVLSREDAAALRTEVDARMKELTGGAA